MSSSAPTEYGVSPSLAARLAGLALIGVGVLVFLTALVVAVAGLAVVLIPAVAATGVVAAGVGAWWAARRARVVRLDEQGYRVRYVRGAGATAARWSDVADAGPHTVAATPCLVLRLRDGRTTTVPLVAVARPEELLRDCAGRLGRAGRVG